MSSTSSNRTGLVRFADTAQMFIVKRHEDYDQKNKVARHELWYSTSDIHSMRRAIEQDVLQVRAQALAGVPFNYAGDGDASADEFSVCCIGIEYLLTPNVMLEMEADRARCIHAVLAEQVRQDPSARFGWEAIALASIAQTRKVALRARTLGELHQEAI